MSRHSYPKREFRSDETSGKVQITRHYDENRKNDSNKRNKGEGWGWNARESGRSNNYDNRRDSGRNSGRGFQRNFAAAPPGFKNIVGNMVERDEVKLPSQVLLAKDIITRVGDYTAMTDADQDDIVSNIKALANVFISVGDLTIYPNEISDLFVKCFSQLSVQVPIIATLLSLINKSAHEFSSLVVVAIQKKLLVAFSEDDIPVSKLLLRSIACMSSSYAFSLEGQVGLIQILVELLNTANDSFNTFENDLSVEGKTALYLLASTIPWTPLDDIVVLPSGLQFLTQLLELLMKLLSNWKSPFDINALQSVIYTPRSDLNDTLDYSYIVEKVVSRAFSNNNVQNNNNKADEDEKKNTDDELNMEENDVETPLNLLFDATGGVPGVAFDTLLEVCQTALLAIYQCNNNNSNVLNIGSFDNDLSNLNFFETSVLLMPWKDLKRELQSTTTIDDDDKNEDVEMNDGNNDNDEKTSQNRRRNDSIGDGENTKDEDNDDDVEKMKIIDATTEEDVALANEIKIATTSIEKLAFTDVFFHQFQETIRGQKCFGSRQLQQTLPSTCSQLGYSLTSTWLRPKIPIFDAEICPQVKSCCNSLTFLEKQVLVGYVQDILHFFDPIVNEDGTKVGSIDLLYSHIVAVMRLANHTSKQQHQQRRGGDDNMNNDDTSDEDAHVEYLIVETLFHIILQLPSNSSLNSEVYRLILELCKKNVAFPPAVALCTNLVFQMIPQLDVSSWREFGKWFAFHLINSKFSWPYWDFWLNEYNEAAEVSSVRLFCHFVVDKCARACIPETIKDSFPTAFHQFIPDDCLPRCKLFSDDVYSFSVDEKIKSNIDNDAKNVVEMKVIDETSDKNNGINSNETAVLLQENSVVENIAVQNEKKMLMYAKELLFLVSNKKSAEDVESWLETTTFFENDVLMNAIINTHTDYDNIYINENWRGHLLLQTLLFLSEAVVSKIQGFFDKYGQVLRTVASTEENQKVLLETLVEVLGHNPGTLNFLLDEMLRRSIIQVAITASWAPFQSLRRDPWVWTYFESIVDRTLDFVKASVLQRKLLSGTMEMDENADLTLSTNNDFVVDNNNTNNINNNDDDDNVVGDDDDEKENSKRGRKRSNNENEEEEDLLVKNKKIESENETDDDPVVLATESVKFCLQQSRQVYTNFVTDILNNLHDIRNKNKKTTTFNEQEIDDQGNVVSIINNNNSSNAFVDEEEIFSKSLLNRIIRSYVGVEKWLVHQMNGQKVVVTNNHVLLSSQSTILNEESKVLLTNLLSKAL